MTHIPAEDRQTTIDELIALRDRVANWALEEPNPGAKRCSESRHRTLGHLRAAQETWLQVVRILTEREGAKVSLPHPWRLFDDHHYATLPWQEHRERYLSDRNAWIELLTNPDVNWDATGTLKRKPVSIRSLTKRLLDHERVHVDGLHPGIR